MLSSVTNPRSNGVVRLLGAVLVVALVLELVGRFTKLPSAAEIAAAVWRIPLTAEGLRDVRASTVRWFLGFLIGSVAGILLATLTAKPEGRVQGSTSRVFEDLLNFARAIPVIGLPTVMIFLSGIQEWGKIAVISWGCVFPVWLNTHRGIRGVHREYQYLGRCFELGKLQAFLRIVVPSVASSAYSGIRIALGVGWICVVAAEWIGVLERGWLGYGLGRRLWELQELNRLDGCVAILVWFGILGIFTDLVFQKLVAVTVPRLFKFDPNRG